MAQVIITLGDADLMELQQILLDDDEKGALDFVKNNIAAKMPEKGHHNCDSSRLNPFLLKPDESQ